MNNLKIEAQLMRIKAKLFHYSKTLKMIKANKKRAKQKKRRIGRNQEVNKGIQRLINITRSCKRYRKKVRSPILTRKRLRKLTN